MFNVAYEHKGVTKHYLDLDVEDIDVAFDYFAYFKACYFNEDGTGKTYPNRKGIYTFSNPRIVRRTRYG